MPNHVTNELTAAKHVIDSLAKGESAVDFETVIPMPDILRAGEDGIGISSRVQDWVLLAVGATTLRDLRTPVEWSTTDLVQVIKSLGRSNALRSYLEGPFPKDFDDRDFAAFLRGIQAYRTHGKIDWYEWSIANWGTKWNSYDVERLNDETVRFDTAWNHPGPVIVALSKKFPTERIRIRWADEDTAHNSGDETYLNGEIVEGGAHEDKGPAAWATYMRLKHDGTAPGYYRPLGDGTYEYAEELDA